MAYKVIKHFVDLQDHGYSYNPGDEYPRKGLNVFASRITELASADNKQGVPLIKEEIDEETPKAKKTKAQAEE